MQFIVKNSYDGTNTLQIALGAFRLVCTNGMVIGKRFFGYSQRHIGSQIGIDANLLKGKVGQLADQFQNAIPTMQAMVTTPIIDGSVRYEGIDKLPDYIVKTAGEEYAKAGKNVWDFYNALTFAITHHMRRNSPQKQIEYGRIAWEIALTNLEK